MQPLRTVSHFVYFDIIIYLGSVSASLLSTHNESIANTLTLIERWMAGNAGSGKAKLDKAKEALQGAGQTTISFDPAIVRKGIKGDMLVSEKIKALRGRR